MFGKTTDAEVAALRLAKDIHHYLLVVKPRYYGREYIVERWAESDERYKMLVVDIAKKLIEDGWKKGE